jgi:hypothetical protein
MEGLPPCTALGLPFTPPPPPHTPRHRAVAGRSWVWTAVSDVLRLPLLSPLTHTVSNRAPVGLLGEPLAPSGVTHVNFFQL